MAQLVALSHHVCMDRMRLGLDELVEQWTVLDDEQELIAEKRGPTKLGFALLLKFFTQHGRFPASRSARLRRDLGDGTDLAGLTSGHVAAVFTGAWDQAAARTWKRHRSAVRSFTARGSRDA